MKCLSGAAILVFGLSVSALAQEDGIKLPPLHVSDWILGIDHMARPS